MLDYVDLKYKHNSKDDLIAEYYIEPNKVNIEKAAGYIAAESSTGIPTTISMVSQKIPKHLKPKVFEINKKESVVKIAYNRELFEEGSVTQVLSSITSNNYGMKVIKNLKLLDIDFPSRMISKFLGPRFGIDGIRRLTGENERPFVSTSVHPKIGIGPLNHAQIAYETWTGGADIVRDSENLTNQKFNKFEDRVVKALDLRDRAEQETGEKKIYMPNITAETAEMIRRADFVKNHGGEYVMVDILTAGLSGLQSVRRHCHQFIYGHRPTHKALATNPKQGLSMLALSKLCRLSGTDQLNIGNEIEERIIKQKGHVLEEDWGKIKPSMAVNSGELHPGRIPKVISRLGKNIVIHLDSGCHNHPDGANAGAAAARQAIDSVMQNIPLKEYSKRHRELDKAIIKWGVSK